MKRITTNVPWDGLAQKPWRPMFDWPKAMNGWNLKLIHASSIHVYVESKWVNTDPKDPKAWIVNKRTICGAELRFWLTRRTSLCTAEPPQEICFRCPVIFLPLASHSTNSETCQVELGHALFKQYTPKGGPTKTFALGITTSAMQRPQVMTGGNRSFLGFPRKNHTALFVEVCHADCGYAVFWHSTRTGSAQIYFFMISFPFFI